MLAQTVYVPILKAKKGELGALLHAPPLERNLICPLIEIPPIPWNHTTGLPAKTIDQHLAKLDASLAQSWDSQHQFFLDFLWIGGMERMASGIHPMDFSFDRIRNQNLRAIPVTSLIRQSEYQSACRRIISSDHRGVCLRLQPEDFEGGEQLNPQLTALLEFLGVAISETDLLLDLGCVASEDTTYTSNDVASLIRMIPRISEWRTFALGATGFPVDLMGLPPAEISTISRMEWALWRQLVEREKLPRFPTYGDYAIAHPQPPEVDPRIMRPSASIRYTTENSWLILKGRNLRDHGFDQFHDVSSDLVQNPEYSGPNFSWGDDYIDKCSRNRVGSGNLTTWRMVGTSHHISYVTRQVASLS